MSKQSYRLEFADDALNGLKKLDKSVAKRILKKVSWLADNADTVPHIALTGRWSDYFKLRVGDYRVIYSLDQNGRLIIVMVVGHRREIYDD
jgi:mRNA interferase RelE/StbE